MKKKTQNKKVFILKTVGEVIRTNWVLCSKKKYEVKHLVFFLMLKLNKKYMVPTAELVTQGTETFCFSDVYMKQIYHKS